MNSPHPDTDLTALLERAIVRIGVGSEIGTGFRVSPTTITTVEHVVRHSREARVRFVCGHEAQAVRVDGKPRLGRDRAVVLECAPHSCTSEVRCAIAALNTELRQDDTLLAMGFVARDEHFQTQSAVLTWAGESDDRDGSPSIRIKGASVRAGSSGGPVLNLRTGGVCGALRLSNPLVGEGHFVPLRELVGSAHTAGAMAEEWTSSLSDVQIEEGQWPVPRRVLRRYLTQLSQHLERHPYGLLIEDALVPPLPRVYVSQVATRLEDRDDDGSTVGETADLARALAEGGVLTGAAGGGKSSALLFLAGQMSKDISGQNIARVPVLVRALDLHETGDFIDIVTHAIARDVFHGESSKVKGLLTRFPVAGGRWHLLVDGLDEVLDARARTAVVTRLLSETSDDGALPATLTVSSRELVAAKHLRDFAARDLAVWRIAPINRDDAAHVVSEWLTGRMPAAQSKNARKRILAIAHRESGYDPLSLTLACQLAISQHGSVPPRPHDELTSRNSLYDALLEALAARFRQDPSTRRQAEKLGSALGAQQVDLLGAVADNAIERIETATLHWFLEQGTSLAQQIKQSFAPKLLPSPADWNAFIEAVVERTGLITSRSSELEFANQVMAEYLASRRVRESKVDLVRVIDALVDGNPLSENESFIAFASHALARHPAFWGWVRSQISESHGTALIGSLAAEGVEIPSDIRMDAIAASSEAIAASGPWHSHDAVITLWRLSADRELSIALGAAIESKSVDLRAKRWALQVLAAVLDRDKHQFPASPDESLFREFTKDLIDRVRELGISQDALTAVTSSTTAPAQGPFEAVRDGIWTDEMRRLVPGIFMRSPQRIGVKSVIKKLDPARRHKGDATLKNAHRLAVSRLGGRRRRSGDPVITHSLEVARILADYGFDNTTLAAAIVHDAATDDEAIVQVRETLGSDVAGLIEGLRVHASVRYIDRTNPMGSRQMFVAMADDLRVIALKIANRLHNARTWGFVPVDEARSRAQETLDIYAPLARELGMVAAEAELENLAFAVLDPFTYSVFADLAAANEPAMRAQAKRSVRVVESVLDSVKIIADVSERVLSIYEMQQTMAASGQAIGDLLAISSVEVVANSTTDCYAAIAAMHREWTPLPGRYADHIMARRLGRPASLMSSVLTNDGLQIDVEVRTREMFDRTWEVTRQDRPPRGVEGRRHRRLILGRRRVVPDRPWTIPDTVGPDATDFLRTLQSEIGVDGIYVYTPKGRVVQLPANSIGIDFAYAIHSDVGKLATGAVINGVANDLSAPLVTADVIEIKIGEVAQISNRVPLLARAQTPRARSGIRRSLTNAGRQAIFEALSRSTREATSTAALTRLLTSFAPDDLAAISFQVATGVVSAEEAASALGELVPSALARNDRAPRKLEDLQLGDSAVSIPGRRGAITRLARCCGPVPSDPIVGQTRRGGETSVHRRECRQIVDPDRVERAVWNPVSDRRFLVGIELELVEMRSPLYEIHSVMHERQTELQSMVPGTSLNGKDGVRLTAMVSDLDHLDRLIDGLRSVDGVTSARRLAQI